MEQKELGDGRKLGLRLQPCYEQYMAANTSTTWQNAQGFLLYTVIGMHIVLVAVSSSSRTCCDIPLCLISTRQHQAGRTLFPVFCQPPSQLIQDYEGSTGATTRFLLPIDGLALRLSTGHQNVSSIRFQAAATLFHAGLVGPDAAAGSAENPFSLQAFGGHKA